MEESKIDRSCPFCGSGSNRTRVICVKTTGLHKEDEGSPCVRVERTLYQVECDYCGSRGPISSTYDDAVIAWNKDNPPTICSEKGCGDTVII